LYVYATLEMKEFHDAKISSYSRRGLVPEATTSYEREKKRVHNDSFCSIMIYLLKAEQESFLEYLALELLLHVLKALPDLGSLDSFLRASPAAFRLFDLCGSEILEAVLSFGVTHEYTCALIRIVALLRSSLLPRQVYNRVTFQDLLLHESTSFRYHKPRWTLPSTKLSARTSVRVLRGILATYRRIEYLTVGCITYYLTHFRALRPMQLVDRNFVFGNLFDDSSDNTAAWATEAGRRGVSCSGYGWPYSGRGTTHSPSVLVCATLP